MTLPVTVFTGAAGRLVADRWDPAGDPRGTVLLLHGGGQTRHSWARTGRTIAAAGWTAYALDSRGHGESDWAPDGQYGIGALVADLAAVVAGLGERPVLVGASMGGITSLVGQGERGDLARALVLVDIVPRIEAAGVARIREFMASGRNGFGSLDEVAAAVRAYNPHRRGPADPDGLRKNLRRGADGRWYWHWDPAFLRITEEPGRAASHDRIRAAAARVRVPTLLVRGAASDVVTDEGVAELRELVPHAEHVEVAGTGHMVAGDDNDVFSARMLAFLDALPA